MGKSTRGGEVDLSLWICRALGDAVADEFGGVVDHGDDAGVVEAGGADDTDRADDLFALVGVRGEDEAIGCLGEDGVFGTDEYFDALC